MFNAEQMLGKMLAGALNSGAHSRKQGLGASLVSQLTSGVGLMTVIGLGVGAFEILKGQKGTPVGAPQVPPPISPSAASGPPPLPSTSTQGPPPVPTPNQISTGDTPEISASSVQQKTSTAGLDGPSLAMKMIRTMIAAANADGKIDAEEEAKILEKFREQDLSREEKQVLLQELHNPKDIDELTSDIDGTNVAQTMYSIAALAITIDTDAERQWMDRLAQSLKISPSMQRFLEDMVP